MRTKIAVRSSSPSSYAKSDLLAAGGNDLLWNQAFRPPGSNRVLVLRSAKDQKVNFWPVSPRTAPSSSLPVRMLTFP